MKKLAMFFATMTLAIPAPLALPVAAHASNPGVADCKADTGNPAVNKGECISTTTLFPLANGEGAATQGFAVHICDIAEEGFPDIFYFFYDSHADCVLDGASVFFD
jgi:hypothetical protein